MFAWFAIYNLIALSASILRVSKFKTHFNCFHCLHHSSSLNCSGSILKWYRNSPVILLIKSSPCASLMSGVRFIRFLFVPQILSYSRKASKLLLYGNRCLCLLKKLRACHHLKKYPGEYFRPLL